MDNNQYFFQSPGAVLLDLNFIQLRWYGLMYALAFLACYFTLKKITKDKDLNFTDDELSSLLYTGLISGIIGARLWYVILSWDYYSVNLFEILQIWHGGQSIQGGILGSAIGLSLFQKKNLLEKMSLLTVVAPLGQAIGRWGNFFNEEAFGKITDLPWKLYISHTGSFHHPTFLYESIWNLICFGILIKLFYNGKKTKFLIGLYLVLYSFGRLVIEPIRTDSLMILNFPAASLIAILGIVIGILVIARSEATS